MPTLSERFIFFRAAISQGAYLYGTYVTQALNCVTQCGGVLRHIAQGCGRQDGSLMTMSRCLTYVVSPGTADISSSSHLGHRCPV